MNKASKIKKQPKKEQAIDSKPLFKRWWARMLVFLIVIGIIFQTFFYFLATPFLKEFIQNKIKKDTDGVYELYFNHLTIDFTGNNVFLTGFHLKPNKKRYKELLRKQKIKKPLYEIELTALLIYNINIFESFKNPGISIESIDIVQPDFKVVDAPNKKNSNKNKFNYDIFHQDLYPAISAYISALNVGNINIKEGKIDLTRLKNKNSVSSAKMISINLNNFAVDSLSAVKHDRLFYSEKINLKIENYSLYLKKMHHFLSIDSIRIITNKEIAIYNAILRPDTLNIKSKDSLKLIINSNIPLLKLIKPNISDIYFKKTINIEKVLIQSPDFSIKELYKSEKKKSFENVNPYFFIEDYFEYVKIKEFNLVKAESEITFAGNSKPNIAIPNFSMKFIQFKLDSNSFKEEDNFFYCKDFEFDGNYINLAFKKDNYKLKISNLLLSTFQKKFAVRNLELSNNHLLKKGLNKTFLDISLQYMSATGIDLKKLYNRNELQLSSLNLSDADIKIEKHTSNRVDIKENRREKKQKNILNYIEAKQFNLSNTNIEFNEFKNNIISNELKINISTQIANFKHNPTKKDSVLSLDFINFSYLKANIKDFYFKSKEQNYQANLSYLSLNTQDSSFRVRNLSLKFDTTTNSLARLKNMKKKSYLNLNLPHLSINKFNLKDLIYNRKLVFQSSKIINSQLFFLSYSHLNFEKFDSLISYKSAGIKVDTCRKKIAEVQNYFSSDNQKTNNFSHLENYNLCALFDSIKANKYKNPKEVLPSQSKIARYDSTEIFKIIEKLPIFDKIKKHLDIIKFEKLDLVNSELEIIEKDSSNRKKLYFKNKTSLAIRNFELKPDSIIKTYQKLFSDSIKLVFKRQTFEIPNSIYKLKAGELCFSFPSNVLYGSNIYIYEKENLIDALRIEKFYNLIIPEFRINGFDIHKFNKRKQLIFDKIYFKNPNISQIIKLEYLKNDTAKTVEDERNIADLLKLKLPSRLSAIRFTDLHVDTASFLQTMERKNSRESVFRSNFTLNISDFYLDTLLFDPSIFARASLPLAHSFFNSIVYDSIPSNNYVSNISLNINDLEKKLSDSIHTLAIKNIYFSMDTADILIEDFSIKSDSTKVSFKNLRKFKTANLMNVEIPKIELLNVNLHKLYYNSELEIDSLKVQNSNINIEKYPLIAKIIEKQSFDISKLDLYPKISPKLNSIKLNSLSFNEINFFSKKDDHSDTICFSKASVFVKNILIDSLSKNSNKTLFNDDISIKIPRFDYSLDTFYKIKFDSLCLSSEKEKLRISGFSISPRLNKTEFGRLKYFQSGMSDFFISQIDFDKFDFNQLITKKAIDINSLEFGKSRLHIYKDLRLPVDSSRRPPMPLSLLYSAKNLINIDSLKLKNMALKYVERVEGANANSTILVEDMNISISNLTNSTEAFKNKENTFLSINGNVMGKAFFNADFTFPMDTSKNEYSFKGYIKPFEINILNNYFINSVFVKIPSGKLDKLKFNIIANDKFAYGKLRFIYHGLKIEVLEKGVKQGEKNRRSMLSLLANGLLKSSNPRYPGTPPRVGKVYFERNEQKQVFNYWILSILSGIKSTMGFDARESKRVFKEKKSVLQKLKFSD